MRILLIRHGERAHKNKDPDDPLTDAGRGQMCDLGRMLKLRSLTPTLYFASTHLHARQSAEVIRSHTGGGVVREVEALKSPSRPLTRILEELLEETEKQPGVDLENRGLIAVVSHEPGLSRLLTRLTSTRGRPMVRGEALCLEATSWQRFLEGQGEVMFRCPATNYEESEFRDKLVSKMQVSTLLAGFSFTALIEVVKEGKGPGLLEVVSVALLTAALGFFVASLYLYDRLAMPAGFWLFGPRSKHRRKWSAKFEETRQEQGLLYTHKVWTWRWMFTPGVFFALAALFVILLRNRNLCAVGVALAAILLAAWWYWRNQPPVGTD